MISPPWFSFVVIGFTLLVALIAWPLLGPETAFAIISAGLSLVLIYHMRNLYRLLHWLQQPRIDTLPSSVGAWDSVFSALYQRERQLARSQQRLENALERFQSAGEAIPDGIIVLDERQRIEWFNPAVQDYLGLNIKQDVGQQLHYLVRHPQFVEFLGQEDAAVTLTFRPKAGSDIMLTAQSIPFDRTRRMLILRDITQMERVNTVRKDFVANVSHELRTPLTVVGGFLETMVDMEELDVQMLRRYLPLMLEQTERMQRLIADLLTLSRLEHSNRVSSSEPINMQRLVNILKVEAEGLSQGRHKIVAEVESTRGLNASADELHSACSNLVSNAVRYTPEGGTITLRWQASPTGAMFAVLDSGIGIASEHIPRLTERFYRVDRSRSRETGGTGLGLAIVKHILMRHQGRLEITSEIGVGSCFACCFPATRVLEAEKEAPLLPESFAPLALNQKTGNTPAQRQ